MTDFVNYWPRPQAPTPGPSSPATPSVSPPSQDGQVSSSAGNPSGPTAVDGFAPGRAAGLSGVFGVLGGLLRSPVFQQLQSQPAFGAAPRPVSSRLAVSQPGAVPGAPFEELLRVLRQAQQGVM